MCVRVCVCVCVYVFLSVIRRNSNPLHPQLIGRRGHTKKYFKCITSEMSCGHSLLFEMCCPSTFKLVGTSTAVPFFYAISGARTYDVLPSISQGRYGWLSV